MSIHSARGNVPGGATHHPSIFVAMAVAVLAAVVIGVAILARSESTSTTSPAPAVPVPVVVAPRVPARATDAQEQSTAYIVSSEADAALLRDYINEADSVRISLGLAPMGDLVVVAEDDATWELARAALANTNDILITLGKQPLKVVRYLGPSAGTTEFQLTPEGIRAEHEAYFGPSVGDPVSAR